MSHRGKKRFRVNKVTKKLSTQGWHNSLVDVPAFIIGNGPSLKKQKIDILKNYFTIGINRAFYLLDPTILMWQDPEVWYSEKQRIPRLQALKYCRDKSDVQGRFYHFKLQNGFYKLPEKASALYGRGSTGPLAFQLAYVLGCNPIVLLGCDCKYKDGDTDFYGVNPCHNPRTLINCRRGLEWMKTATNSREIINCSNNDIFDEKHKLSDVLGNLNITTPHSRESLIQKITS